MNSVRVRIEVGDPTDSPLIITSAEETVPPARYDPAIPEDLKGAQDQFDLSQPVIDRLVEDCRSKAIAQAQQLSSLFDGDEAGG